MSVKKNILFIDFDDVYLNQPPPVNYLVLNQSYDKEWAINVYTEYSGSREVIVKKLDKFCDDILHSSGTDLAGDKMYLFDSFFYPLGSWLRTVEFLIKNGSIVPSMSLVFSSYSSNKKVFVFEAEALEPTTRFLYKPSYHFSSYIREYLKNYGLEEYTYLRNVNFKSKLSFILRGILASSYKLIQLLCYKIIVWKRLYKGNTKFKNKDAVFFTSRTVVQSQFLEGVYNSSAEESVVIINESSRRFFKNLKYAKNNFRTFVYAEGFLSLREISGGLLKVMRSYASKDRSSAKFYGLRLSMSSFSAELSVKRFHLQTYALSVKRAIDLCCNSNSLMVKRIISFEMMAAFAYYLKEMFSTISVVQIQTSLIGSLKFPNFVYSDLFYFTSSKYYEDHVKINHEISEKFGLLDNIKYLKYEKSKRIESPRTLVYFTQPVYLDEELEIINNLISVSSKLKLKFAIKLHPRSNRNGFIGKGIDIIEGDVDSMKVISKSDLVCTRNSSIGMDCWYLNTPVLFFLNASVKGEGISYIPSDYLGNLDSNEKVENLVKNLNGIIDNFYVHSFQEKLNVDSDRIYDSLYG